jgi:chemotaxis protein MotB
MPRRRKHEEHMNHEAWAIPYGDLVTLLLAFFVVMYAISSLNEGKYRVLSDSLFAAFRGAPRSMQPIQVGEKQVGSGADIKTTIVEQAMIEGQPRSMLAPVPVKTGMPERQAAEAELNARQSARARALQQVADEVARAMDSLVKANMVVIRRTDFWIEVEIQTDILFPSASAQLEPGAVSVIEKLGEALAPFPNAIRVEGHTDNRPIRTVAFISNWELSAARAGTVVRVLASKGVHPGRLAVIGYGENRPSHTNDNIEGRNANRRVIVVILSTEGAAAARPTQTIPDEAKQEAGPADPNALPLPAAEPGAAAPLPTAETTALPATSTAATTSPASALPATTVPAATAPVGALAPRPSGTSPPAAAPAPVAGTLRSGNPAGSANPPR